MLEWYRKRKIDILANAAKAYVDTNYKEPTKPSGERSSTVKFSRDPQFSRSSSSAQEQTGEIRFSIKDPNLKSNDDDVQYSLRDNYNSRSIDSAVRSLSSSVSTLDTIKAIENNTNMSFVDKMLEYINTKHMRDSDVYKAAQVDRRLFSKIVSDRTYKPAKDTCIAISLALKLSLSEANDFLSRAGYVLSHSSKRDVVIEYFFREQIYDLDDVNEVLFRLEQKTIGR